MSLFQNNDKHSQTHTYHIIIFTLLVQNTCFISKLIKTSETILITFKKEKKDIV